MVKKASATSLREVGYFFPKPDIVKNSAGIIIEASIVSFLTTHFDVENFIYGDMSYSAGSKAMNLYIISDRNIQPYYTTSR